MNFMKGLNQIAYASGLIHKRCSQFIGRTSLGPTTASREQTNLGYIVGRYG